MADGTDNILNIKIRTQAELAALKETKAVVAETTEAVKESTEALEANAAAGGRVGTKASVALAGQSNGGSDAELAALEMKRKIRVDLAAAIELEARGETAAAEAIREEVAELMLAAKLKKEMLLTDEAAAAFAKKIRTDAAAAAELKVAQAAAAKAAARAEEEQAAAARRAAIAEEEQLAAGEKEASLLARAAGVRGARGGIGLMAAFGIFELIKGIGSVMAEFRKLDEEGQKTMAELGEAIRNDAGKGFEAAGHAAKKLTEQIRELHDAPHTNIFSEMYDDAKAEKLRAILHEVRKEEMVAAEGVHKSAQEDQAVSALRLQGYDEAAKKLAALNELMREEARINERFKTPLLPETTQELLDRRAAKENALNDARTKWSDEQDEKARKLAETQGAITESVQERAAEEDLIAKGMTDEAAAMKDVNELGKALLEIQKQERAGVIDTVAAEQRRAALIDIFNSKAQIRADKAMELYKTEQARVKGEEEKAAEEAARDAEKKRKLDEQFQKEKDDGEALIAIAQAKARGEDDVAKQLQIQKTLKDRLAQIEKTDLEPAQKARLADLAREKAALDEIANARDKFNKHTDAAIAERNKTPRQKQQEREGKIKGRQQERIQIQKQLDAEDQEALKNHTHRRTNAEQDARRKELERIRGKALSAEEERKNSDPVADAKKLAEAEGKKANVQKPPANAAAAAGGDAAGAVQTAVQAGVQVALAAVPGAITQGLQGLKELPQQIADGLQTALDAFAADVNSRIDSLRAEG